jgi:hypothetical protein
MIKRIAFHTFFLFAISFITFSNSGCYSHSKNSPPTKNTVTDNSMNISIQTFQDSSGWGYDIVVDGKLMIHQPHIPAISGYKGFESKDKALVTAEFVVSKIRNKIVPPSVSVHELDSLGVIN